MKESKYYKVPMLDTCPLRTLYIQAVSKEDAVHKARSVKDADPDNITEATHEEFFRCYLFVKGAAAVMETILQ